MKRKVAEIVKGFTNAGRFPYVSSKLECGHGAEVPLRPDEIECRECGHAGAFVESTENERPAGIRVWKVCAKCRSGSGGRYAFTADHHNDAHRLINVGDEVDCKWCDHYREALEAIRGMDRSKMHHARCVRGTLHIYRRDPSSPSGVLLEISIESTPESEELLRSMGLAALSPTEGF